MNREIKNKVYTAEGDPDYGCIYIAAKNGKEAKQIAMRNDIAETVYNPYIDLRITRCWSVKETEYKGILGITEINNLGLTWWECPNCSEEDFEIISAEEYKCKNCGNVYKIPYMNC